MNSRERVFTALDHKKPDRVPLHASFVPQLEKELEKYFKLRGPELYINLGNDLLFAPYIGVASSFYKEDAPSYIDEWGITWKWTDIYTEPSVHPLSNNDLIATFQPPDPLKEERYFEVRKLIYSYGKDFAIVGGVDCSIFEVSWYLRGFDKVLTDFYINKDLINILLDKTMNFSLQAGLKYIEEGIDIIRTGDDFGTQRGNDNSP